MLLSPALINVWLPLHLHEDVILPKTKAELVSNFGLVYPNGRVWELIKQAPLSKGKYVQMLDDSFADQRNDAWVVQRVIAANAILNDFFNQHLFKYEDWKLSYASGSIAIPQRSRRFLGTFATPFFFDPDLTSIEEYVWFAKSLSLVANIFESNYRDVLSDVKRIDALPFTVTEMSPYLRYQNWLKSEQNKKSPRNPDSNAQSGISLVGFSWEKGEILLSADGSIKWSIETEEIKRWSEFQHIGDDFIDAVTGYVDNK